MHKLYMRTFNVARIGPKMPRSFGISKVTAEKNADKSKPKNVNETNMILYECVCVRHIDGKTQKDRIERKME